MRGEPVRMAVLLQPVADQDGQGMATIQVAETLELRRTLARQLLWTRCGAGAAGGGDRRRGGVGGAARHAAGAALSDRCAARAEDDLSPMHAADAPRELQPLIDATNTVMAAPGRAAGAPEALRARRLAPAAHPAGGAEGAGAVGARGDVDAAAGAGEIGTTVDRATELANQMLALAKVEQLRQQGDAPVVDWADRCVRAVALDLAPLIADASSTSTSHRPGAGARPRVGAARAGAQPAAQRHQAHARPAALLAMRLAARRSDARGAAPCRRRPRHRRCSCAAAVPAVSPPATRAAARAWAWPSAWRSCAPPAADRAGQPGRAARPGGRAWMRPCACRWQTIQP
jgi:two-component system sensor histidine kinase TctE